MLLSYRLCIGRDWRRSFCTGLLLSTLLAHGGAAHAQANFDPATPEKFDGQGWNGLTLGQSTTDDIKHAFKTSKGAYRPEGMVLPQPNSSVNVQTLMDGRGGGSHLIGFRLAYRNIGPDLQQLASSLNEQPKSVFPRERFSDWGVQVFARAGIAAFVIREGVRESVPLLLLTTPDRINQLVRGFSDSAPSIGNLRARFNPDKVRIEFGVVSVDREESSLKLDNASSLESELRSRAESDPGSPNLRYASGSGGYYRIHVSLEKPKDKEGNVSVSVWANGDGPFGKVSASGSGSATFDRALFGTVNVSQGVIMDAFRQARAEMGRNFTAQVRRGLPSSPKAYREQVWNALTDSAVR